LTSTHYILDFSLLRDDYDVPEGVVGKEAELEAVRVVDASMADPAATLANMFEVDLFPDAVDGEVAAAPSPRAPEDLGARGPLIFCYKFGRMLVVVQTIYIML
jgi:hypothetical protein